MSISPIFSHGRPSDSHLLRPGKTHLENINLAEKSAAEVYNLTVLVRSNSSSITARAANLAIPEVEASTIREALSQLVCIAKATIDERLSHSAEIPWMDPPHEASDSESRFVVPLHL